MTPFECSLVTSSADGGNDHGVPWSQRRPAAENNHTREVGMDDSIKQRLERMGMKLTPALRRDYELHREHDMEPAWARVHSRGTDVTDDYEQWPWPWRADRRHEAR